MSFLLICFWLWVVLSAGCGFAFVWGLVRGWELEIFIPPWVWTVGSLIIWIGYLVLDKIGQHISFH